MGKPKHATLRFYNQLRDDGVVFNAIHHPTADELTIVTWEDEALPHGHGLTIYKTETVIKNITEGAWKVL